MAIVNPKTLCRTVLTIGALLALAPFLRLPPTYPLYDASQSLMGCSGSYSKNVLEERKKFPSRFVTLRYHFAVFSASPLAKMSIKINGHPQMSFEQFEKTFKEAFGRDMTPDERRWLRLANFLNADEVIEQTDFDDDAA